MTEAQNLIPEDQLQEDSAMDASVIRVLLVSDSPHAFSLSQRRLERNGCQCQFANSETEVGCLLEREQFDIVLSTNNMRGGNTSGLSVLLSGSRANLFCAVAVEEGCLWLPILRNGMGCFGMPALRPSEFASHLDEMVEEIRTATAVVRVTAAAAA